MCNLMLNKKLIKNFQIILNIKSVYNSKKNYLKDKFKIILMKIILKITIVKLFKSNTVYNQYSIIIQNK